MRLAVIQKEMLSATATNNTRKRACQCIHTYTQIALLYLVGIDDDDDGYDDDDDEFFSFYSTNLFVTFKEGMPSHILTPKIQMPSSRPFFLLEKYSSSGEWLDSFRRNSTHKTGQMFPNTLRQKCP